MIEKHFLPARFAAVAAFDFSIPNLNTFKVTCSVISYLSLTFFIVLCKTENDNIPIITFAISPAQKTP